MTGAFVSLMFRTTEYILMTKDGIYKTSNVKRASEGNQYDEKCLDWAAVDITELVNKGAVTRAFGRPGTEREGHQEAKPTEKEYVPRKFRITEEHLAQHGYTVDCPECIRRQTGIGSRTFHSDTCRQRIQEEFLKGERGREKVERSRKHM